MAISRLGGGAKWTELASSTISAGATSISFTSISSNFKQLLVSWIDILASSGGAQSFYCRFNNDTNTNYAYTSIKPYSGGYSSNGNNSLIQLNSIHSSYESSGFISINDANDIYKKIEYNNFGNSVVDISAYQGIANWYDTSAINQIDLFVLSNSMASGTIKLYGRN